MIRGIALAQHLLPVTFVEAHGLQRRLTDRGGEVEYQFLWSDPERLLPIMDADGGLRLVNWGNRREEARELPVGRCTQLATIAAGGWDRWQHQPVDIPCTLALERGV